MNGWIKKGITRPSPQVKTNTFSWARANCRFVVSSSLLLTVGLRVAAKLLDNQAGFDVSLIQLCFQALLNAMSACRTWVDPLESGVAHFLARYRQLLVRTIPLLLGVWFT